MKTLFGSSGVGRDSGKKASKNRLDLLKQQLVAYYKNDEGTRDYKARIGEPAAL